MTISKSITHATLPIFVIALIAGLGIIPSVADVLAGSSSGSYKGENSAPTLGIDFKGQRIIENGLKINGHTFMVESFSQTIPTQTFKVDQTVDVTLHFYVEGGIRYLAYTSLLIDDGEQSKRIQWNQNFKGIQTVSVFDSEFFKNVEVTLSEDKNNPNGVFLNFKFQISKNTETSTLKITSWSHDRHSTTNYFYDAIKVGKSSDMSMKSSDMSMKSKDGKFVSPLKQTRNGILVNNIQCNAGRELMIKHNGLPFCVYPADAAKLIAMNWGHK